MIKYPNNKGFHAISGKIYKVGELDWLLIRRVDKGVRGGKTPANVSKNKNKRKKKRQSTRPVYKSK